MVYYCNQKLHRLNQQPAGTGKLYPDKIINPLVLKPKKNLVLGLIVPFLKCDTVSF